MYSHRCFVKGENANTVEYMKRDSLTDPTTIRVTESQKVKIRKLASELGHRRAADAYRHVMDLGFRWLDGERPPGYVEPPAPPPAVPREALDAAERLARDAAELAERLRGVGAAAPATSEPYGGEVVPFPGGSNVDDPQELRDTEVPVVAYVAAGEGRDVQPIETGETTRIPNPQARRAAETNSSILRVAGDSMDPPYSPGDFVIIEPTNDDYISDGKVCYVVLNGDPMLKTLRFSRNKRTGRMDRVTLVSENKRYPPIPVYPTDHLRVVGVEVYHVRRGTNFR